MPKINVYLPDELAEAVKAAGVPVSAVCQRALENAVRRVTAIRETVLGDLDADEPTGALAHFTPRTRAVLAIAIERARGVGAPRMATEHLLAAMLEEGTNLALHVLRAMEIDPRDVARDLARQRPDPRDPAPEAPEDADPRRFDGPTAAALELAVTEATSLGHNYVGCEHLLLGLATEPDGVAGGVLRGLGAEPRLVRRAVTAALAGYVHLRAQQGAKPGQQAPQGSEALAAIIRREIAPLGERIARLEEHLGLGLTDAHG
jgi:ATP-dependent Clp protease ATP-binding subunit ClpA